MGQYDYLTNIFNQDKAPLPFPLPNGGMTGDALANYIKQNPGPPATIGYNPNNPGILPPPPVQQDVADDSDDEEDVSPAKQLSAKAGSNKSRKPATSDTAPSKGSNVSDMIKKLTGGDDDKLAAAQAEGKQQRLIAGLGSAGNMIGAALGTGIGTGQGKADNTVYNNIEKNSEQAVKDVKDQQMMKGEKLKQAEAASKLATDAEKSDSGSDISKAGREIAKQVAIQAGLNIPIPDNISLSQLEKIMPGIENMANRKATLDAARINKDAANGQHAGDKQEQYMGQTIQLLESARGNPEVQQAMKNRLLVKNAQSIIHSEVDPNHLDPRQLSLLVTEIGKIASGGVPGHEELKQIMPNTFAKDVATIGAKVMNRPTPANAGAFVKMYNKYLDELQGNSDKVLKDRMGRVIESNSKRIGDDNASSLRKNYSDFLNPESLKPKKAEKAGGHPQDEEAITWANQNPNDPKAAAILKANGM